MLYYAKDNLNHVMTQVITHLPYVKDYSRGSTRKTKQEILEKRHIQNCGSEV